MTREEAIRWLKDIHLRFNPTGENLENEGGDVHLQALDMAIEALRQTGWIPVSERLPSKAEHRDDMVLVCYGNGSIRFNTYMNGWVQGFPIAWMPLPEPYKGGDEE